MYSRTINMSWQIENKQNGNASMVGNLDEKELQNSLFFKHMKKARKLIQNTKINKLFYHHQIKSVKNRC